MLVTYANQISNFFPTTNCALMLLLRIQYVIQFTGHIRSISRDNEQSHEYNEYVGVCVCVCAGQRERE